MGDRTIAPINGTLATHRGQEHLVELEVTTVQTSEEQPIAAQAIRRVRLLSSDVPDGEYLLAFSFFKPYCERVRVQGGMIRN